MVTHGYQSLSEMVESKNDFRIKARISRLWTVYNIFDDTEEISLDMVLIDENEDQIHAMVKKNLIKVFKSKLKEGGLIYLDKFEVEKKIPGKYQPVSHKFRILFNWGTKVSTITEDDQKIQRYSFELTEFEELTSRVNTDTYLTDVIGMLVGINPIQQTKKADGKVIIRRNIFIQNQKGSDLRITLWGKSTTLITEEHIKDKNNNMVIVVTSTTVKEFQGEINLSSTMATKVYINLDIPESKEFSNRCKSKNKEIQIGSRDALTNQSMEDKPYENRITLYEMEGVEEDDTTKGKKRYTCKATISEILYDYGWYYASCQICTKKISKNNSAPWCEKCEKPIQQVNTNYMLKIRVKDSTGSAIFTVFGKQAQQLVKYSVYELHQLLDQEDGQEKVHNILDKAVDTMHIFQIRTNEYNTKKGSRSYTVSEIFEYVAEKENKHFQDKSAKELKRNCRSPSTDDSDQVKTSKRHCKTTVIQED